MDAIEAIRTRRSVGKLDGDVSAEDVRELVSLALCAPNHKLTNPWRFIALRGAARERLGEVWASAAGTLPVPPGVEREAFLSKERRKPLRAPVLIVAATRTAHDPVQAEEDFAACAAAVQNLLLAAHAKGLGAMWRTGEMAHDSRVKSHLGLDATDRIVAFVYLGRPAMPPPSVPARDAGDYLVECD